MFFSEIAWDAWTGTRARFSPLLWPYQPSPGPNSWRIWRRLLANAFVEAAPKRVTPKTHDLHLLTPLGAWLPGSDWRFHKWEYSYSPSSGKIYHSDQHHYTVHSRRRRSRHHSQLFMAEPNNTISCRPDNCFPVEELSSSPSLFAFRGMKVGRQLSISDDTPTSFDSYIQILPLWDHRLLQHVDIKDVSSLIAHLCSDVPLFIVSDGNAADALGSYGALLGTEESTLVTVSGSTEGASPGSFRAESYGCLAIFCFLYYFRMYHGIDPITCLHHFYCDNQGLITRLNNAAGPLHPFPRHFLRSDIDLDMQIVDTIEMLDVTLSYTHVKGHQDDDPDDTPLTCKAQLNVECDVLAIAALLVPQPASSVEFLPASKVSVTIDGTTVTRKIPRTTHHGWRRQIASFSRRYGWTTVQFDAIDWPNIGSPH
jgi:hypothetical protein